MRKPNLLWGAFIGGIFMIALVAISFLGQQATQLPFVPFDLFDWLALALPEPLINFGRTAIQTVVNAIQIGNTSNTAKTAENLLGAVLVVGIGMVAGALFVFLMNRIKEVKDSTIPGIICGVIVGLPFILFTFIVNLTSQAEPVITIIWLLALFGMWGFGVGWAYDKLVTSAPAMATGASVHVIDRRTFLVQVGASAATLTVVGAGLGNFISRRETTDVLNASAVTSPLSTETAMNLPNADDMVQPAPGTRAEVTALEYHYRIDIRSDPNGLVIPAEGYTLLFTSAIGGTATTVAELTLEDIRNNYEEVSDFITMSCISNYVAGDLISTLKWTGVRMKDVLASMTVPEGATHLKIRGGDGFDEIVALDTINNDERVMLCHSWEDKTLSSKHGFPLRIHIPNLYGMKQPKWIISMEFLDADEDGYWVRRGWSKEARVNATSVIDTVATDMMIIDADANTRIPIGGIAWAGDRGIVAVEVRVNEGEWAPAQIRTAINDRTWNIWRYDWLFVPGMHTFEVRCVETGGVPQVVESAPVRPDGATGIHSVNIDLRTEA